MLVVIMSVFGAIIRSGFLERRHEIEMAEQDSLLLVRSLAAQQKQIEITTKEVLARLAQSPEVQTLNEGACNVLLNKLNGRHPNYSVLGAMTPDGTLFASSGQFTPGGVNLLSRKHVQDAIRSHDFSAGEYTLGRITGVETIHYAYPVLDLSKHLIAVVSAGFRLDKYAGFIAKANLPIGSVVVITDHNGIRLYRSPESAAAMLGRPIPNEALERMSGDLDEGVFEGIAGDGTYRINAFKRLKLRESMPPYLYVTVGIVRDKLLQGPNFIFSSSLLIAAIAAFAAVAIAWVFSNSSKNAD